MGEGKCAATVKGSGRGGEDCSGMWVGDRDMLSRERGM